MPRDHIGTRHHAWVFLGVSSVWNTTSIADLQAVFVSARCSKGVLLTCCTADMVQALVKGLLYIHLQTAGGSAFFAPQHVAFACTAQVDGVGRAYSLSTCPVFGNNACEQFALWHLLLFSGRAS